MIYPFSQLIKPLLSNTSISRDFRWLSEAAETSDIHLESQSHGHLNEYRSIIKALGNLSKYQPSNSRIPSCDASGNIVVPGFSHIHTHHPDWQELHNLLTALKPWRKGPWQFGDITIDTEWRSDWKWNRVLPGLESLKGKRVLDVGCGSGYHLWRMVEAGAALALGVEPFLLNAAQFYASRTAVVSENCESALVFPLTLEQSPQHPWFHTVFSMGVLSHRKSPFDHLSDLRNQLLPGGQLVLENLVIDGSEDEVLIPKDRYAKMRNVWFIPSAKELCKWVKRSGFLNPRIVDITLTTRDEQRATDWMEFESLADYLDPKDSSKTIEGYPAPKRAVITAQAPA